MTALEILSTLEVYLKEQLKDYRVYDKDQRSFEVNVFSGALPKKMRDTNALTYYPAVYPITLGATDTTDGSSINVRVVIAVHDDGVANGHVELFNLVEKVRQILLKATIIDGRALINLPIKWETSLDTTWPIWQAWAEFTVDIQQHRTPTIGWFESGVKK